MKTFLSPLGARAGRGVPLAFALASLFAASPGLAQSSPANPDTSASSYLSCGLVADTTERLACYDRAARRGAPLPATGGSAAPAAAAASGSPNLLDPSAQAAREDRRARGATLGERWELDPSTKQGTFVLRPYKPMYVLPIRWMNPVNQQPYSEGVGNSVAAPQNIKSIEAEFQVSLKAKVWETIGGSNVDLWVGYTQSSQWQVYTAGLSRPFRETNYEPELFAVWGVDWNLLGWRTRFLSLGVNHQSNGREEPLSRSWNRVIAQVGFERGDWSVLVRPWWRIQEKSINDDNPGIENYIGRGEIVILKKFGAHFVSAQLRHSLRGGDNNHGSAQIDWSFPIKGYLKGHLQVFTGYGDTLIDFNHRSTTIGMGVSLTNWL